MEELDGQNTSPIPEPHESSPPGDKQSPLDADEAGLAQYDQVCGADATYCSSSSASPPCGSDAGLLTAATLESAADDISAGDKDAFSRQASAAVDFKDGDCTRSYLREQVTGGEADVLVPQCSSGAPPSCSSGGAEKFIASESNAAYMAPDDADDKNKASRVGVEGGENISAGMNEEILLHQGSPAVSPSGSVGGIQKFAAFETDTTSAIVGGGAVAAEEAVSQMNVVGGKQMNDSMQEETLIPQSSSAVFHSSPDSDLLKVDDNETGTSAKNANDFGTVEEIVLKTDVGSVPISKWQQEDDCLQDEVLLPQGSPDAFLSGSDGCLLKYTASEIDTVNNNPNDAYAVEDARLKMDVDSVPISQWQGQDGTQEVVLIPQNSYALPSGSDSDLLKFAAFQTATASAAASKVDVDSAPIILCKQLECGESFVSIPKRPSTASPFITDGTLEKVAAFQTATASAAASKMDVDSAPIILCKQLECGESFVSFPKMPSTASPFITDGTLEKVAASDPDTVATPGYDVAVKEEVMIVDDGSSDNVQPFLYEQINIVAKADISMPNDSSCKFNPESGTEVLNNAATEPDTVTMSHEIADAMDDIPAQIDADADDAPVVVRRGGGRKKRGRPAKVQVSRISARRKEEEDVCFICFDGGDLVVCDRRGCPKVYHPSCVNRDEAFFRAKGRWSCGWHICSSCESSASHMCFTCTHSLCKGCIKEAGFFCVRGNKGFCEACMSTVMLIESNMQGNDHMIGVDFDDRSSFEYLFKDYYLALKAKLSLTLDELMRAKDSIKRSDVAAGNEESSDDMHLAKEEHGASSDNSSDHKEERTSKRKLRKKSENTVNETESIKETESVELSNTRDFDWASDELLEFVEHMKNGDRSPLSQFDVQNLLLDYIKRNNLRDPRKKSQIVCDSRLQNLFGKPRVGHFEMLKLLESHFFTKEVTTLEPEDKQGGVVDPDPDPSDGKGNNNSLLKLTVDKKRKTRKKLDEKEQATNLDDYAAIDVHNISLMYLRRNLMEDLVDETDFDAKVIGSFVRIRISGVGQRQDMYRLVQVVGTGKAVERYKTGKKTTDVTLEILNLNKKETITVDIISNQEFTEEECKRLRQSIKCGFIGPLTVGDVQEKARSLQVAKVNDWLESEKLRLGHLRDRASETGRRKELRECIEKLQLLNTPEERYRRLNEVPEIHTDPHMDPDYESAEEEETDIRKQEYYGKSRGSSFLGSGREVKSPRAGVKVVSENWSSSRKNSNTWESNRSTLIEGSSVANLSSTRVDSTEFSLNQANDIRKTSASEAPKNHELVNVSDVSMYNEKNHITAKQSSDDPLGTQKSPLPGGFAAVANPSESDKIWHYKDPSGKVQGPFSMTQLRKWNTTGYFPPNLRIWRTSEKPEDSILLADALIGKFDKDLPEWEPPSMSTSQPVVGSPTVFAAETSSGLWQESNDSALSNSKHSTQKWNGGQNENWTSRPSSWSSSGMDTGVSNVKFGQAQGQNKSFVSQPSSQYYENAPNCSTTTNKLSSNISKVALVNESLSERRNDSSNVPTPTSQPNNVSWSAVEGFADKHMPSVASAQDITASLVSTPRGREEEESSFTAKEPLRSITNSFRESSSGSAQHVLEQTSISDGGKSLPTATLSAYGTVSTGQTIASTHEQSTSELLSSELNQLTSSKLSDTRDRLSLQQEQNDPDKQLLRMHDFPSGGSRSKTENAGGKTLLTEMENLTPGVNSKTSQADSARMVGSLDMQIYQASAVSYPASHFKPEKILPEVPAVGTHPSEEMATKLFVHPGAIESCSTQRSAAPKPEPMHSANYEIPTQTNTSTNLTPSALHMTPYGRNSVADFATVSKKDTQLLSSDGSNPLASSQFAANVSILPVQPSQLGFGAGSNTQTTTSVVTPKPTQNLGPAQGSGNMIWTPVPQGNMNAGWGMVAPGGMNMPWGQPPQTISDVNMAMGAQSQVNTVMNTGWVAPAQGNTNMNVGWVASAMGNTSQTPGWTGPLPGNFPVNPVWAMLIPGQANPGPGWVAPVPQNPNQNQNWQTPAQGSMNMNTTWVPGQGNTNPPVNQSAGNPQNLSQLPQHGDTRSGQGDNSRVNDSWHSNRRPPPNWAQSGGGSSGPQRGQMGICRFYETGYCKKGASCNYIHQR